MRWDLPISGARPAALQQKALSDPGEELLETSILARPFFPLLRKQK
jgi:hypothetical protein